MTHMPPDPEGELPAARPPIGAMRQAYLDAILAGHLPRAERIIREAIDSGLLEGTIDSEIIAPAMMSVGDAWKREEIGIADEHLATDISLRMIALQRESFRVARKRSSATVLLAAAEDERHTVGLEMAASALMHAGFDVRMLGADVPSEAIAAAVEKMRPRVLGLTATTASTAVQARRAIHLAHRCDPKRGIVIGGAAARDTAEPGRGIVLCINVGDAVDIVDALAQRASLN